MCIINMYVLRYQILTSMGYHILSQLLSNPPQLLHYDPERILILLRLTSKTVRELAFTKLYSLLI